MSTDRIVNLIDASEQPADPDMVSQQAQSYIRAALGAGLRRDGTGMSRMVHRLLDEHGRFGAYVATGWLAASIAEHVRPCGATIPVRLHYGLPEPLQRDAREFQQNMTQLVDLAVSGSLSPEQRLPSDLIAAYRDDLAYAEPILMIMVRFLVNVIGPLQDLAKGCDATWSDYKTETKPR